MFFPGVELRDNIRFIHREMAWHHVVKIGSRQHSPFGRYDDSRAEHYYSHNSKKHRTFSRKLSHIYMYIIIYIYVTLHGTMGLVDFILSHKIQIDKSSEILTLLGSYF